MGFFRETRSNNYVETQSLARGAEAFPLGTIPLSSLSYDSYKALKNSDLWTAVNLLSRDVAKLDIKVKQNGVFKEGERLELLLNKKPNPYYNGYVFKYITMMNALLTGHGYIRIVRNPNNQPFELYHVKTSQLQLKERRDGKGYFYEFGGTQGTEQIAYEDIINIMPFSMDGINGLKVLDALQDDLNNQKFTKGFFTNFFANGGQNSGIIRAKETTLNGEAKQKLRSEFEKVNSGESNAGKVIVLDQGLEYEQLEIDSSLLDVINKNQTPTKAIAKAFQIPLSKFAVEMTNSSLKDVNNDYLTNCLGGYMKVWESELGFKLISDKEQYKKEFKFDISSFRQIDWEAYTESLRADLEKGAITHDEYRISIGRAPYPDDIGAVPRYDLNHISASVADNYQLRKTSTNNQAPNPDTSEGGENTNE